VVWQHAIVVDNKSSKMKCNYCHNEKSDSASRFKHHLATTRKTVEPCRVDLYEVRQQMLDIVHKFQRNHINKRTSSEYIEINMEGGKG